MKRRTALPLIGSIVLLVFLLASCGGTSRTSTPRLRVELTSPTASGTVTASDLTVTGIVSNPAATVTINGTEVSIGEDGAFSHEVPLSYGSNRLIVRAEAEGHSPGSRSVSMTRALQVNLLSPAEEEFTTDQRRVNITGTVSDPNARVFVTGSEVAVGDDGHFSTMVDLHYALTILPVTAEVEGVAPVTKNYSVRYDSGA